MRVLALDHGTVRCGAAISDPTGTLATPLPAVSPPEPGKVAALVDEYDAELVEGPQARLARAFADEVGGLIEVPVEMHDERLTTSLADRSSRAGARADRDSLAAAHLLESWLAARPSGAAMTQRTRC